MGRAAILVMWPGPFEQTFIPLSQGGYTWNLASIDPVVSEEKMFENVDNVHTYPPMDERGYLYYKLTYEPKDSGELKTDIWHQLHSVHFMVKICKIKNKYVLTKIHTNLCQNIAVFSEKTDVPHLPNQSMVAISVMKLWPSKLGQGHQI